MKLSLIIYLFDLVSKIAKALYNKKDIIRGRRAVGDQRDVEANIFKDAGEPTVVNYPGLSKRKPKKR